MPRTPASNAAAPRPLALLLELVPGLLLALSPARSLRAEDGGAMKVKSEPVHMSHEVTGVFVPAEATALSIEPEAYEGELRIEEVVAHGARVREGDVVLRVRSERAEEMVRQARWTLRRKSSGSSCSAPARVMNGLLVSK